MGGYNNDYNKDLYTAQSSDFCKSCYSSGKSRSGCLVAVVLVLVLFLLYRIVASVTASQPVAVGAVILAVAAFIILTVKKRNKG